MEMEFTENDPVTVTVLGCEITMSRQAARALGYGTNSNSSTVHGHTNYEREIADALDAGLRNGNAIAAHALTIVARRNHEHEIAQLALRTAEENAKAAGMHLAAERERTKRGAP